MAGVGTGGKLTSMRIASMSRPAGTGRARKFEAALVIGRAAVVAPGVAAFAEPASWGIERPRTDFTRHAVPLDEIVSGGPPKDGIPAVDRPQFVPVGGVRDLTDTKPVVAITIGGRSRAYPLCILVWHEIVNDSLGGVPITVTYCPLCNSSIVFDRRIDGRVFDFGTTGKLRNSDLVMYDRQTESWWQQFLGQAIAGEMTGKMLTMRPSRLESVARFRARAPDGEVLVPADPDLRRYGANPYASYDSVARPFLFRGPLPEGVAPMMRVVAMGAEAWTLALLCTRGRIETDDLVIE